MRPIDREGVVARIAEGAVVAKRLTALGYRDVYDYRAGKQDRIAGGMPVEKGEVTP